MNHRAKQVEAEDLYFDIEEEMVYCGEGPIIFTVSYIPKDSRLFADVDTDISTKDARGSEFNTQCEFASAGAKMHTIAAALKDKGYHVLFQFELN